MMMTSMETGKGALSVAFSALWDRYKNVLGSGHRAELRRVRTPEELRGIPALYHLLAGTRPGENWLRVVFMLPWIEHRTDGKGLGEQLATAKISEARIFQVVRSHEPNDFIQLRRILQQVEPVVDIERVGMDFFYWNRQSKHKLLEDYLITKFKVKEGKNG